MRTMPIFAGCSLAGLLAIAVSGRGDLATGGGQSDKPLLPGAKLVHKFDKEVYRPPVLLMTDKGPWVAVWFDAFDPAPPQRVPGPPPPDPQVEMFLWDALANKEVCKFAYPADPIAIPPVKPPAGWTGWVTLSQDGKRIAFKIVNYTPPAKGQVFGNFTTQVKTIDLESRKVQLIEEYKEEKTAKSLSVYLAFAPDGALVSIRGTTCTVQEVGKDKPRITFEVKRAAEYKTRDYWLWVSDVVVSPDGSQLAVCADGAINVYDLATGRHLFAPSQPVPAPKKNADARSAGGAVAYAPAAETPTLLAVESVVGASGFKDYVLCRQFDLKEMKEIKKWTVTERHYPVFAYYTAKGQPRVLYDGKILDGTSGKEVHSFDAGAGAIMSRDGKVLVRVTKKKKEERTTTVEVWSVDSDK
jgi:WD40 repeat protein